MTASTPGSDLTDADRASLRALVDGYADAVDRRDGPALRDLFTDDGAVLVQAEGGPVETEWGGSDIPGLLETVAGYERTFHHVGGCVVEPDGAAVTGRSQCLAHHYERTGNGPVDLVMMVRYHDRFVRTPAGWRIARRRVAVEWTELHPAHPRRRS
ncbi:MAG TPA: nuclear transport factor 2 family protein [Acidimicrobiales bacterium]|nr:nuclear transport factor 2 family protein [Acidimicrobiales bacterium]